MEHSRRYNGRKLGAVIDSQGRTRRWVAAQAGISESMLSRIIGGSRCADTALAERLAAVVQVPLFLVFDVQDVPEIGTECSKERVA